jgi:phenylacetate-CoA ligase
MSLLEPEIEAAPWEGQAAADDAPYRRQLAFLLEHSRFYRAKLTDAGFASPAAAGGLADIANLPFTEKDELRAAPTPPPLPPTSCASIRPAAQPGRRATFR